MSEQPDPQRVAIRCDVCLRRSGRPPLLAEVTRLANGTFRVGVTTGRLGRRAIPEGGWPRPDPRRQGTGGGRLLYLKDLDPNTGLPDAPRHQWRHAGDSRTLFIELKPGQVAVLACSRCSHRPRERHSTLVELAEQAVSAGRRDAYV